MNMNWLLVFIPIGLTLDSLGYSPMLVFLASALAIVPLAKLMGDATEVLARALGATLGGLMNATLGNAPEIIISFFALHKGLVDIVKASITGSIIGNLLFGLGLAMFAGGLKQGQRLQKFDPNYARMNGALLFLSAFGLIIPSVFTRSAQAVGNAERAAEISLPIAGLLLFIYCASFVFTVQKAAADRKASQQSPLPGPSEVGETSAASASTPKAGGWSRNLALLILAAVTVGLAVMSEVLTGALEPASKSLGLTPLFTGVFMLALVGNAAELFSAVRFARNDQLDVALGITVGASIQVALVVVPLLVFFGSAIGQSMNLVFSFLELIAIILSVTVTRNLIVDGQSSWLEGLALMVVYFMLAVGFYHVPIGT